MVCPITNLRFYVTLSQEMSIELKSGFLFRATDRRGYVTESSFSSSAAANRLRKYMTDLKIRDGETLHSFRSGFSIMLSLLGTSYGEVAKHVGWRSLEMAIYYTQFDKVLATADASSVIARATSEHSPEDISWAEKLGIEFRERNYLKGYNPLFSLCSNQHVQH